MEFILKLHCSFFYFQTYILLGDLVFKYKISMLFILIVFLCTFSFVKAGQDELPLFGKVIYLDPGHGGVDPGAIYNCFPTLVK